MAPEWGISGVPPASNARIRVCSTVELFPEQPATRMSSAVQINSLPQESAFSSSPFASSPRAGRGPCLSLWRRGPDRRHARPESSTPPTPTPRAHMRLARSHRLRSPTD
ncbi:hypothetical protein AAFF_G00180860 [Aldrovandia affinis]|uniref:Uncharacterized protein n=1 Tax=Aldrovandia affinis TaxID=143900 RepID=A0AAD7T0E4_9TELE|nr:hypothetical protein AAFF_G00180860 [Aldrovandia affinis]